MSVNSINISRAVLLVAILAFLVLFVVLIFVKTRTQEDRKRVFRRSISSLLLVAIASALVFSPYSSVSGFKVDEELKKAMDSVSIENIDQSLFEEPEDSSEEKVLSRESEGTVVYFSLDPHGAQFEKIIEEQKSLLQKIDNKYFSKKIENKYGKIRVTPVSFDNIYTFFVESFYGHIALPIGKDCYLYIRYECDTSIKDCKQLIQKTLNEICLDKA